MPPCFPGPYSALTVIARFPTGLKIGQHEVRTDLFDLVDADVSDIEEESDESFELVEGTQILKL